MRNFLIFAILLFIAAVAIYDIFFQRKHTVVHNFPVVGHIRYWLERIGPELRQYIVASNHEELPFSRRARSWIYASAKGQNNLTGYGSDANMTKQGHVIIKNAMIPKSDIDVDLGHLWCKKTIGKTRVWPYFPRSIVNISGMSFGALSGPAVTALNGGAKLAGCYQNTGEGGLSEYHKQGGDIIFQIGTGYFGVQNNGKFSMKALVQLCEDNKQIKAIDVKLSQGAKPGKGGILPASKMTEEISKVRGVPMGQAAVSPNRHSEFSNVQEMVDFIERIADATGLPVGIKSAVGKEEEWEELATIMEKTGEGPDFITIDGGEGGTGAAPSSFTDHLSLPFNVGFPLVHSIFERHGLLKRVVFIGSGKLGLPAQVIKAFAMGCDLVNVGREAMLSIGCIQAQQCHTNTCPSGVATQNKWLSAGLDPTLKTVRCANYIKALRKEVHEMTLAAGYTHPAEFKPEDVLIATGDRKQYQNLRAERTVFNKETVTN